jgi:TfoX/Sxy family transcriptional regulator of competence genes
VTAPKKPRPKATWKPAPAELAQQFAEAIGAVPGAHIKKMFGYPAAFVNGKMFAGLFGERMFLRLGEHDRASFELQEGARPFEPVRGRVMHEYVTVPEWLVGSGEELQAWLAKAAAYAGALPPKLARPRREGK